MKNEIRVGLTVLAGIALLYVMIAWVKRIHFFAPRETLYQIQFDQVGGLLEGDPVHVRGYLAGRVVDIRPEHDFMAVTVSLDERIGLFMDTRAEIRIKELLGGKMIEIFPGADPVPWDINRFIPGKASADFASAFSGFEEITGNLDIARMNRIIGRLDTLTGSIQTFSTQLDPAEITRLTRDFSVVAQNLNQLLAGIRSSGITGSLDTTVTAVNRLLSQTEPLMEQIQGVSRSAETALVPRADSLLSQMETTLENLNQMMTAANGLMENFSDKDNIAGRVLTDPNLSAQLDTTLYNLNKVLEQIHSQRVIVGMRRKKGE
ncbi:MAG: MlaD family protein [Bacteroidia bacterium]|nr:MlaD family protein [Bacteroidia bacterium]